MNTPPPATPAADDTSSAIRQPQAAFVAGLGALAVAAAGQWLLDQRATVPAFVGGGILILGAILFALVERRARTDPPTGALTTLLPADAVLPPVTDHVRRG